MMGRAPHAAGLVETDHDRQTARDAMEATDTLHLRSRDFRSRAAGGYSAATVADYQSAITVVGTSVSPLAGQPNPVTSGPVQFTVTFARPVSGFDASDVTLVSSPGGRRSSILMMW